MPGRRSTKIPMTILIRLQHDASFVVVEDEEDNDDVDDNNKGFFVSSSLSEDAFISSGRHMVLIGAVKLLVLFVCECCA